MEISKRELDLVKAHQLTYDNLDIEFVKVDDGNYKVVLNNNGVIGKIKYDNEIYYFTPDCDFIKSGFLCKDLIHIKLSIYRLILYAMIEYKAIYIYKNECFIVHREDDFCKLN